MGGVLLEGVRSRSLTVSGCSVAERGACSTSPALAESEGTSHPH